MQSVLKTVFTFQFIKLVAYIWSAHPPESWNIWSAHPPESWNRFQVKFKHKLYIQLKTSVQSLFDIARRLKAMSQSQYALSMMFCVQVCSVYSSISNAIWSFFSANLSLLNAVKRPPKLIKFYRLQINSVLFVGWWF